MKNNFLLIFYLFMISILLGDEYEKKYNPLKVSINAPIDTEVFDLFIYNSNNIKAYKAVNKDIIEIETLPKGHYILTIQSGNFIGDTKFIELVDLQGNEGADGADDIVYLNVLDLEKGHPDLFRSSPTLSHGMHYYNFNRYSEGDLILSGMKYKLMALPAAKKLWAKYNIIVDDSLIKWNEIQIIRFMDVVSAYNDILFNNSNLPISIWRLSTGNNFTLDEADGVYSLSLPVKYFEETINQINHPDTRAFYHKLDESIFEFVKTIFDLPNYRNFLYNVDYYSTSNENFIIHFEDAFNEEPKKYFEEFSDAEIRHISNTLNFIGFKSRLLKDISYCAKANDPTGLQVDGDNIDKTKFTKQCIFFHADDFLDNSHPYKGIMISFLNHYFAQILTDDLYRYWQNALDWTYDNGADKWTNGGRRIHEYYGIVCDTPKNEFVANVIYYLYTNEFSPTCTEPTINLLRTILFDSDVYNMSYDTHIKSTSIYISGEEDQDKIIDVELEAKSMEQGAALKRIDLLIKNNFGFFEIMTLAPQPGDVFTEIGYVKLKSTLKINKNTRTAIYYIAGININYGDSISNNFLPVDYELVFPIDNIAQDLSPPEMLTESMKFKLTPLDAEGTELVVSFSVRENYSMNPDLNSFIYIKSPGINEFYIEMFGYGVNSGNSGYFTETGQCILRTVLPSYYPSGEYTIANIELYDDANNVFRYNDSDPSFTPSLFKFILSNENPDATAPEIDKDKIMVRFYSNFDNSPDESSRFPVVFMNLNDEHSGVGEAIFTILDSDQNEHTVFSLPEDLYLEMLNTEEEEIYNTAFPLYHKFENIEGGLILTSLIVKDKAHNPATLEMINIKFDASYTPNTGSNFNTELTWKIIDNDFGIYFKTSIGYNYRIERSTDLVDWVTIQEIEGNDANYYFMDVLEKTEELIFYRTSSIKKN